MTTTDQMKAIEARVRDASIAERAAYHRRSAYLHDHRDKWLNKRARNTAERMSGLDIQPGDFVLHHRSIGWNGAEVVWVLVEKVTAATITGKAYTVDSNDIYPAEGPKKARITRQGNRHLVLRGEALEALHRLHREFWQPLDDAASMARRELDAARAAKHRLAKQEQESERFEAKVREAALERLAARHEAEFTALLEIAREEVVA